MLGLGDKPQVQDDLIKDATEASFLADVIETSQTVPVIVVRALQDAWPYA
jgi:putative thioredoxin